MTAALLINPQYPHNVSSALRACALLGATTLYWTGDQVPPPHAWPEGARLPREERMRIYNRTRLAHVGDWFRPLRQAAPPGVVPVCVEVLDSAEDLRDFQHPEDAVYVFGPENGSVPKGIRSGCHRFVRIPTYLDDRTPYNLAASLTIVLYDRLVKLSRRVVRDDPWEAYGRRA